jgi:hypothetical protein
MHHFPSIRRVAIGAALAGAAIGVVPAMASAAPVCSYDTATKTVTVFDDDNPAPVAIHRTSFGRLFAGANSFCTSSSGVQATITNTDLIKMLPITHKGAGDGVVIDESQGPLAPGFSSEADGSPEIEISVQNVTPLIDRPVVKVIGTSQRDFLTVGGSGVVNLDGDTDADVTVVNDTPASVQLEGRRGNDVISGQGFGSQGATHLNLKLLGGDQDDTIFGGLGADVISGDAGADNLQTVDGVADTVSGGADGDRADVDALDHVDTVETPVVH